jgi:hypothetical protein
MIDTIKGFLQITKDTTHYRLIVQGYVNIIDQFHLLCVITDTHCCIKMQHAKGRGDPHEQGTHSPPFGFLLKV